jgi:hypothetical protein
VALALVAEQAAAACGLGAAAPLLAGAATAVLVALPAALAPLLRPAGMLATTLYVR